MGGQIHCNQVTVKDEEDQNFLQRGNVVGRQDGKPNREVK